MQDASIRQLTKASVYRAITWIVALDLYKVSNPNNHLTPDSILTKVNLIALYSLS